MAEELADLVGRIEFSDRRLVKGWALDRERAGRAIRLQVSSDRDEPLGEIVPSIYRGDLRAEGYGTGCHGFVFEIPERQRLEGATLHFRFAESARELDNSPVRVSPRDERAYQPYSTTELTGHRVLVLAPHPDDESLACGGSLALHREAGDPVKILFLTDGSKAAAPGARPERELAKRRRREAEAACDVLGVDDREFWDIPDRALSRAAGAAERLAGVIEAFAPTLIYAPSPLESHPDHRAAAELLWGALQSAGDGAAIAFYDFNRPILVNTLVDVTAVQERKRAACRAHQSQLEIHPYAEAAESLSRYRALTVSTEARFVEGFFVMPAAEVKGRAVESFTLRQFLPRDAAGHSDEPLVSIVVRTQNRPALLREALGSILGQTYSSLEVIVVNDGGVDVAETVAEAGRFLPVRQVRHEEKRGRSAAANSGVREATGRYLVFLDDDDVLYPSHVSKLVGYLEATGERLAYSDCEQVRYRWRAGFFEPIGSPQLYKGTDFDRDHLYYANYIPFMTAMIRRDLVLEAGPFDESLSEYEDWDFLLRVSEHADFQRLPGVTALYRAFASHDYGSYLGIYRKHADHWTLERLAAETWPRMKQLLDENHQLRLRDLERQREVEEVQRVLRSVVESYSWRLTRKVPDWAKRLLKGSVGRLRRLRRLRRPAIEPTKEEPPAPPSPRKAPAAAAREATQYVVRPYREGDELRIVALFEQAFGKPLALEEWRWKYADHPVGSFALSVAVDEAGELLAHYGAVPCRLVDSSAGERTEVLAYQICDTMTSRRARVLGSRRTSPLYRVTQDFFARFCEGRVAFNFGFNTGKIQRFYLRLVEGSRFLEPAPNRALALAEGLLPAPLADPPGSCRIERVARFDRAFDELFERVAADYRFLQRRDSRYLRWRYLDRPGGGYRVHAAWAGDRLVGWAVFRRDGDRLIWGDSLIDPGHVEAAGQLLHAAVASQGSGDLRRIEGWFSSRPTWWSDLVAELGFEPQPDPEDLGMIYLPFEDPAAVERSLGELYYTRGDSDLF